nr:hypothetical protein [Kofleriaceae bacterium]
MRAWLAVTCALGCSSGSEPAVPAATPPPPPPPSPSPSPRPPVDATPGDAAPPVDAGPAACGSTESPTLGFPFGSLSLPTGWCWRRTAEGDDLSGIVVDDHARVRANYTTLAHGDKVGDSCDARRPDLRAASDAHARGLAFRSCQLDDGHHCISFHGAANICTVLPELPGFALPSLVDTLAHR